MSGLFNGLAMQQPSVRMISLVLIVCLGASPVLAHLPPIPIGLWGNFPPASADCQRVISRAAAACASTAWRLSNACAAAQVSGGSCDIDATRASIETAHAAALASVVNTCGAVNFTILGYSTMIDIQIDVDVFCQELQDAMMSAVYGPVEQRGVIRPIEEPERACITATAEASTRLLHMAFRSRRHTLDRIASAPFAPSEKFALVGRSTASIARGQARLAARLASACPDFNALYGRSPMTLLTQVAQRADCLSGRVHVQDYVVCPMSICGNGMQEPTERCDDGNTTAGDGCSAFCQRE